MSGPLLTTQGRLLIAAVVTAALGVAGWAYASRPYQHMLSRYVTSVADRSEAQRQNIRAAAARLDGAVVGPGERFSFNALVGPRTPERGFTEANAFLEGALTRSIGGGVCQVASTVYAAVQPTSLPIRERAPHFAIVRSIPPGRDASVWYGKSDLVWENSFRHPLRLHVALDALSLRVELWGTKEAGQSAPLRFSYRYGHLAKQRQVAVFRRINGENQLLSQDVYRLQ